MNRYLLVLLGLPLALAAQTRSISGSVVDAANGESLPGVVVSWESASKKTNIVTNTYGLFSLTVPTEGGTLKAQLLGYTVASQAIKPGKDAVKVAFRLNEAAYELGEVAVQGQKLDNNVKTTEMSVSNLSSKEIKKIPQLLGETDIVRTLTLLPGVSTVGEASSGFNVRGGNADQNLILLDEAPVYSSSHLFGFFSIFNADAVRDVTLYKGGMPSNYGGRLSSVLDVRQKEGNSERFAAQGGIGLLSSRLTVEGPLVKRKASFMVSGRRSYFDLFLPFTGNLELQNTTIYFYDVNAKVNATLSDKDRVFASMYFGRDQFGAQDLFDFGWGNWTSTLRWNRSVNSKLFFNATAVYSDYTYSLGTPEDAVPSFKLDSRIQNTVTNLGWTYYANARHKLDWGVQNTYFVFSPGQISGAFDIALSKEYANESALYFSDDWKLTERLSATVGLRYSGFANLGPRTVYQYADPRYPTTTSIVDTTVFARGEVVKTFLGPQGLEPRVALNYVLGPKASLKASYNRSRQYIHLISNNTTATPVNVWRPAGTYINPATVDQVAVAAVRNFREDNGIRLTVEAYAKTFQNLVDYRDGADLVFTDDIETELLTGSGRAYGAEVLLEKKTGKLTGWVGYTLGRTERMIDGPTRTTRINNGDWYPANYDKLHDVSVVLTWAATKKWDVGGTWIYQSGRPITYPDARGEFEGIFYPVYTNRNGARTPATHRLDVSITRSVGKRGSWNFGVYNAYGRRNPYSIFFRADFENPTNVNAYRLSIFGSAVPFFTYNFSF
ncbi:MAG: hypothetical protein RIR07_630 [Bacteroidota bacterium]